MNKKIYLFFLISFLLLSIVEANESIKINIFSEFNQRGLDLDQKILKKAIKALGYEVESYDFNTSMDLVPSADVNIFFQNLIPNFFSKARLNWFVPNPEWYQDDIKLLDQVDLILCRTREVERIFSEMNRKTHYLGFTSLDSYLKTIPKNFHRFIHIAGGSILKGTYYLIEVWKRNPQFPLLTIIHHRTAELQEPNIHKITYEIPRNDLRKLQNNCGIHLCLSETEGFGHYIMEAMSTCAVVVATDAPPMNEFIIDSRCLIPCYSAAPVNLAIHYYIDQNHLTQKIKNLLSLPEKELRKIGYANRIRYLEKTEEFRQKLKALLSNTVSEINTK